MTQKVQVAVIRGGIVGCSALYGLAKRGRTDAVLLERRQLTSGSTWHAAGNTTYSGPYGAMTRLFTSSIETYLEAELSRVIERSPAFGEAGIKTVNNGPICYTPDGLPLLGPVEGHDRLWLASGSTVGIGTGGGAGQFLAHWMVEGGPSYDLPVVYPSRFSNHLGKEDVLASIKATYERGYKLG